MPRFKSVLNNSVWSKIDSKGNEVISFDDVIEDFNDKYSDKPIETNDLFPTKGILMNMAKANNLEYQMGKYLHNKNMKEGTKRHARRVGTLFKIDFMPGGTEKCEWASKENIVMLFDIYNPDYATYLRETE